MKVEWSDKKRNETLAERGLDFADVGSIDWRLAFTNEDRRKDYAEVRFVTMAPIHDRLCVFVWCWRGDAIRVISLRKANERERKLYDEALHHP